MNEFEINKILNQQEIDNKRIILNSKPLMLMFILTNKCNLDCIMCDRKKTDEYSFSYKTLEKFILILPFVEIINWQGGEVFLLPYFKDFIKDTISFKNIKHEIVTNGTLIDEEWLEIFSKINVELIFSIDGVTKKTYETIRKNSSFEKLLRNLEIINKFNLKNNNLIMSNMNVVVMKRNYEELVLFPDFCERYGIRGLRLDFLRPTKLPEDDIVLNNKDEYILNRLYNIVNEVKKKCIEKKIFFRCSFLPYLSKNFIQQQCSYRKTEENLENKKIFCELPWKKLFIDVCRYGYVFPDCLCVKPVGNIYEHEIDEIWNGLLMQTYRKKMLNKKIQDWCSKICVKNLVEECYMKGNNKLIL